MAVAVMDNYKQILNDNNNEVRNLVLAGVEQINEGKTKDFNLVCDRLENKYKSE